MENYNDWYIDIVKEIGRHKDKFSKRDYKKYKLGLLLRMAKRVANFSAYCVECQNFQGWVLLLVLVQTTLVWGCPSALVLV